METLFNIEEINPDQLNLNEGKTGIYTIKWILDTWKDPNDEIISWVINSPPFYAAKVDEELKKRMEAHGRVYSENRDESIRITRLIKKQFYEFLCTDSKNYSKERQLLTGNINNLITGLAAAIATNVGGIAIGVVTTFVTFFVMLLAKMSKRVACEYMGADKSVTGESLD
jgi:hypothetical protein